MVDRVQAEIIRKAGYAWEWVTTYEPKATYYKLVQGEVVACPNLPADTDSLRKYLSRGFVLDKTQLENKVGQAGGFPCPTCGKVLKTKLALAGHMRSHK